MRLCSVHDWNENAFNLCVFFFLSGFNNSVEKCMQDDKFTHLLSFNFVICMVRNVNKSQIIRYTYRCQTVNRCTCEFCENKNFNLLIKTKHNKKKMQMETKNAWKKCGVSFATLPIFSVKIKQMINACAVCAVHTFFAIRFSWCGSDAIYFCFWFSIRLCSLVITHSHLATRWTLVFEVGCSRLLRSTYSFCTSHDRSAKML